MTQLDSLNFLRTTVAIRNAGDGLSKAMHVSPPELEHRQTVHVVLECEVIDIGTPIIPDTDGNELKYVLKAGRATFMDSATIRKALDQMSKQIEAAEGKQALFDKFNPDAEPGEGDES